MSKKIKLVKKSNYWERVHNVYFNLVEFDQIKTEYGKNSFAMSPTQFEFASWLSSKFKRLKVNEAYQQKLD